MAISRLSAEGGAKYLKEIITWRFADGNRPTPFFQ
jgi:hypothetical protein